MTRPIVLVHGGFHGAWCWRKVERALRSSGHDVYSLDLSGAGGRAHLLSSKLTQSDRIEDVVGLIESQELDDVILCVHSAAGMMGAGVAERIPKRLSHLVFLDACVPTDGQSLLDVIGNAEGVHDVYQEDADKNGDGWRLSASTLPPDLFGLTEPDDQAWFLRRRTDDSLSIWREPLAVGAGLASVAKTYIRCQQMAMSFSQRLVEQYDRDPEWSTEYWDVGHDVMVSDPDRVTNLLSRLSMGGLPPA